MDNVLEKLKNIHKWKFFNEQLQASDKFNWTNRVKHKKQWCIKRFYQSDLINKNDSNYLFSYCILNLILAYKNLKMFVKSQSNWLLKRRLAFFYKKKKDITRRASLFVGQHRSKFRPTSTKPQIVNVLIGQWKLKMNNTSASNSSLENATDWSTTVPSKAEGIALCSGFLLTAILISVANLLTNAS